MRFINPTFLYAFAALAIPVIVHLFNFRRYKKILFPNIRFLKDVREQTRSKSRLKYLLILLARLLAFACLVMAFARPYLPVDDSKVSFNRKSVAVYLDNSFSMEATGERGSLFDEARNRATEILDAYKQTDRLCLLSNATQSSPTRFVSKEEFEELLFETAVSPNSSSINDVLSMASAALSEQETDKEIYIISDFQKNAWDPSKLPIDSGVNTHLVLLPANRPGNLLVDSCWFENPFHRIGIPETIIARVRNLSGEEYENIPVKAYINGSQRAVASFSVAPQSYSDVRLPFTIAEPGLQEGYLEITDYPITYDDKYYFSFMISRQIPVMVINDKEENKAIRSVFAADSGFVYSPAEYSGIDFSVLSKQSFIILNAVPELPSGLASELQTFVGNGGTLLVIPSDNEGISDLNGFLGAMGCGQFGALDTSDIRSSLINLQHPVFQNVFEKVPDNMDMPTVYARYPILAGAGVGGDFLIRLVNGNDYCTSYNVDKGQVVLLGSSLDRKSGDITRHALFVVLLYNLALTSQPTMPPAYVIGADQNIMLRTSGYGGQDETFSIRDKRTGSSFIPGSRAIPSGVNISVYDQVESDGNYQLYAGDSLIGGISFNFDRKESNLDCYTEEELYNQIIDKNNYSLVVPGSKTLKEEITLMNQGNQLWKWFILGVLLFIAAEILLVRLMKN